METPLVKFDTAAVYDKFIGETEKRIQKVFRVAEGLAPASCGSTNWKRFCRNGPDSASATRAFPRACWRRSFPGCRSASPPSS